MSRSALVAFFVVGCHGATSRYIALAPDRPTKVQRDVHVFLADRPKAPFVELGVIVVCRGDVFAKLQDEGARHGCDAVVANPPTFSSSLWQVTATCIAYR